MSVFLILKLLAIFYFKAMIRTFPNSNKSRQISDNIMEKEYSEKNDKGGI